MTIAFQSATTLLIDASTTGNINVPGSTVDGDMLIMALVVEKGAENPTVSGWTIAASATTNPTFDNLTRVWYRRASSEPANYTITIGSASANSASVAMCRYTGVISSGSPLRTTNTTSYATLGTPKNSESLTGVLATDMGIHVAGVVHDNWNSADYTLSGPGGSWNQRVSNVGIAADSVPGLLMIDQLGSGAVTACSTAGTGAADTAWAFVGLALIPQPDPPSGSKIYTTAVRRASTW